MHRRLPLLFLLPAWLGAAPPPPVPPAKPLEITVDLDGDGAPERVTWARPGTPLIVRQGDRLLGEVPVPAPPERLAPGAPVLEAWQWEGLAVAHASWSLDDPERHAELVVTLAAGQLRTIFSGITGPQGHDREWSLHVGRDPRGLLRYQRAPGVSRCDGDDALFPELYDPASDRFRAVSIDPQAAVTGASTVRAVTAPPAWDAHPPLGLFRYVSASTQLGDGRRGDALRPPRELADGLPGTAWYEGMAGWGRGAWVTAQALAPEQDVVGLKLVRAPGTQPRRLVLFLDREGPRYVVDLPPAGRPGTGESLWIALPQPVRASCVSLALADAEPGTAPTGLAEAAIYTAYDAPGGVTALAQALVKDTAGSSSLANALSHGGAPVVEALAAALPTAPAQGRTRLVRVLLASDAPNTGSALVDALSLGGADERRLIHETLTQKCTSPTTQAALAPFLRLAADEERSEAGRAVAIRVLGACGAPETSRRLLTLALSESRTQTDASTPDSVRETLVHVLGSGDPAQLLPELHRLVHLREARPRISEPAVRILGALAARARTALPGGNLALLAPAAEMLQEAWKEAPAEDFSLRFRILRAARQLGHASLLPLLTAAAADPDEALRWAAVQAAVPLGDAAGELITHALTDPDPRVRIAALEGLGAIRPAELVPSAARLLTEDRWPMVRLAAAEKLSLGCPDPGAQALVKAAGRPAPDRDEFVRSAALRALGTCQPTRATEVALSIVPDQAAPLSLRETAAALIARQPPRQPTLVLTYTLEDLLTDPAADERTADLAVALIHALGALADPRSATALLHAATEPLSPAVRAAALAPLGALCPRGAARVIAAATSDPDPNIRAAAQRARTTCHR
ncbi:MAG TPA: HEAT repeat domain-containing protein [Polyangia bacterium]|jgi:HEAT repeat protein|nr:HEAT repeat domain-containing protein [Polyangia bacterium]